MVRFESRDKSKTVVPGAGLEPARFIQPRDFKSLASTNFATRALTIVITKRKAGVGIEPASTALQAAA